MTLPFQQVVEKLVAGIALSRLVAASAILSETYRREELSPFNSRDHLLAYLLVRMPATYAAVCRALEELPRLPVTTLDVGAGPGTATWAVLSIVKEVRARLVEMSAEAIAIGKELGLPCDAKWEQADLAHTRCRGEDLTLLSYVFAESVSLLFLEDWAEHGGEFLLIVEPGTPRGYARVLEVRTWALRRGYFVVAPCPHMLECPMQKTEQWCHMAVRVERSRLHRQIKQGELGFEDEKFSYMLISKNSYETPRARIVGIPRKNHGRITLPLCIEGGLEECGVLKRDIGYKRAKKMSWGDPWSM